MSYIPAIYEPQYLGMIIDFEKKEMSFVLENGDRYLAYSDFPDEVFVFCCVISDIIVTFTQHIKGIDLIESYLKNPQPFRSKKVPSSWVEEHTKPISN